MNINEQIPDSLNKLINSLNDMDDIKSKYNNSDSHFKKVLSKIYLACYRFNLRKPQIIYLLRIIINLKEEAGLDINMQHIKEYLDFKDNIIQNLQNEIFELKFKKLVNKKYRNKENKNNESNRINSRLSNQKRII